MARYRRRFRFRRRLFRLRRRDRKFVLSAVAVGILVALAAAHSHPVGTAGSRRAGHLGGVVVTSGSEHAFISATLTDLGAPVTSGNVMSLARWFPHEFPSWPPMAAYNPMASTMPESGATIYNSVGVRNYTSASQGAQATAATLADGNYPRIVADLRSGRGLCSDPSIAGELSTWSGGGYTGVC